MKKKKLCLEHPKSFGNEYIKLNLPTTVFTDKIENLIMVQALLILINMMNVNYYPINI